MISLLRAPFVLGSSHCTLTVPLIHGFTRIAVDNTRIERIAKAEEGLADMRTWRIWSRRWIRPSAR